MASDAVVAAAIAYCDQLCTFNVLTHPEVHSRRLALAEVVSGYHGNPVGPLLSPESASAVVRALVAAEHIGRIDASYADDPPTAGFAIHAKDAVRVKVFIDAVLSRPDVAALAKS